jgi:cystathionine gamma-synthase
MKKETRLVHGIKGFDEKTGAISYPIYQSATFRHPGLNVSTGYDYSRVKNPTREELESTVAILEEGNRCWAFSSGMAAISTVFKLFKSGDHILLSEDLYGGTHRICNEIYAGYGIEIEYVDTSNLELVKRCIKGNTAAIFIETPSNPMMFVSDIEEISKLAKKVNALLIVDNTFLSPYFQKPISLGADIVVHSGTKYLCGHNDVIAGFLITGGNIPKETARIELIYKTEGAILSPFDSWLMIRSIKTLGVRMEKQQENALIVAKWLKSVPTVKEVYYVGLPEHVGYEINKKQALGSGGMISFRVTNKEIAQNVLSKVKLIYYAESLGGVETLITYPISQTHAESPKYLLEKLGVDNCLLRLSIGIENVEDIIIDLEQALREV